jgi:hypothetical protein
MMGTVNYLEGRGLTWGYDRTGHDLQQPSWEADEPIQMVLNQYAPGRSMLVISITECRAQSMTHVMIQLGRYIASVWTYSCLLKLTDLTPPCLFPSLDQF